MVDGEYQTIVDLVLKRLVIVSLEEPIDGMYETWICDPTLFLVAIKLHHGAFLLGDDHFLLPILDVHILYYHSARRSWPNSTVATKKSPKFYIVAIFVVYDDL